MFAKEGAKVIVNCDTNINEAKSVIKEITDIGSESLFIKCDVSDEKQVKKMIDEIIGKFDRIDILVNNAGIVYDVPFKERTVEQWKRTLEVNLIGTFICSKRVAPYMQKNKNGKIINISSTNGINTLSTEAMDYDASKAGIINLTKNLADELAPTINVNSVAPGWVDTDMNKNLPEDFVKEEIKRIYLKRFAKPEEIASAVLFLASDDANFITGTTLVVDGGHS
jgi:3-oxoacyl-[acyl-carrier protein] reductase